MLCMCFVCCRLTASTTGGGERDQRDRAGAELLGSVRAQLPEGLQRHGERVGPDVRAGLPAVVVSRGLQPQSLWRTFTAAVS